MSEQTRAEAGSPEEHPARKVLRLYVQAGQRHKQELTRLEREGKAFVLCPPDCPGKHRPDTEHAHTWWDMYRLAPMAEYECQLQRAGRERNSPAVDVRQRLRAAGVGERHVEALYAKMDERPAFRCARNWWSQPRPMREDGRAGPRPYPWLLLLGDTGTGKSLAAAWCLREHFRAWRWNTSPGGSTGREVPPGLFFPAADLMTMHALGWDGAAGRATLDDLRRTPLLVLDDLGAVPFSEHVLGLLYGVLEARYREGRLTVLTANFSAQDFERRFDFRGGQRGEDDNAGRLFRRCEERGYIAHLTRRREGMGGKLTVGGKPVTKGQP